MNIRLFEFRRRKVTDQSGSSFYLFVFLIKTIEIRKKIKTRTPHRRLIKLAE